VWYEKGGMGGRTIGKLGCGMGRGGRGRVEFLKMDGHGGLAVATEDCV